MIVMRHAASGAPHQLARICRASIINAGDGMHEHPTQALLDAFTIREHKGRLEGLRVAIVGDLLHSRVLRSNVAAARRRMGAEVRVVRPADADAARARPARRRASTTSIDDAVDGADVVMMLRVQHERMHGLFLPVGARVLHALRPDRRTRSRARAPDVIVMHPGPMNRGVEIDSEVADGPCSVILDQVANGVAVRMAVLYLLAGGEEASDVRRVESR